MKNSGSGLNIRNAWNNSAPKSMSWPSLQLQTKHSPTFMHSFSFSTSICITIIYLCTIYGISEFLMYPLSLYIYLQYSITGFQFCFIITKPLFSNVFIFFFFFFKFFYLSSLQLQTTYIYLILLYPYFISCFSII